MSASQGVHSGGVLDDPRPVKFVCMQPISKQLFLGIQYHEMSSKLLGNSSENVQTTPANWYEFTCRSVLPALPVG